MQLSLAPGASALWGHEIGAGPVKATALSVFPPRFVTVNRYAIGTPAAAKLATLADAEIPIPADAVTATAPVAVPETVLPAGVVAVAWALSAIVPASTSAWLAVYGSLARHAAAPPGASVTGVQVIGPIEPAAGEVKLCATPRALSVTLPVFLAVKA